MRPPVPQPNISLHRLRGICSHLTDRQFNEGIRAALASGQIRISGKRVGLRPEAPDTDMTPILRNALKPPKPQRRAKRR